MSIDINSRYQELQRYVGWTAEDARRVASVAGVIEPQLPPLVIERSPAQGMACHAHAIGF